MAKVLPQKVLELALEVGRIILQSGGNTNRVELMMRKVCNCFGYPETESYEPLQAFLSALKMMRGISSPVLKE